MQQNSPREWSHYDIELYSQIVFMESMKAITTQFQKLAGASMPKSEVALYQYQQAVPSIIKQLATRKLGVVVQVTKDGKQEIMLSSVGEIERLKNDLALVGKSVSWYPVNYRSYAEFQADLAKRIEIKRALAPQMAAA